MDKIYGWAFPISVDESTGRIKEVTNEEVIHQSVKLILQTNIGERIACQDFGCSRDYIFEEASFTMLKQIEREVKQCLTVWEQRISSIEVAAEVDQTENSRILLDISYKIADLEMMFHYYHNLDMR